MSTNTSSTETKGLTIKIVINGTPAMDQTQRCDFHFMDEKTKTQGMKQFAQGNQVSYCGSKQHEFQPKADLG